MHSDSCKLRPNFGIDNESLSFPSCRVLPLDLVRITLFLFLLWRSTEMKFSIFMEQKSSKPSSTTHFLVLQSVCLPKLKIMYKNHLIPPTVLSRRSVVQYPNAKKLNKYEKPNYRYNYNSYSLSLSLYAHIMYFTFTVSSLFSTFSKKLK